MFQAQIHICDGKIDDGHREWGDVQDALIYLKEKDDFVSIFNILRQLI